VRGVIAYAGGVRVVSMLPSATEIVYALGVDDQLVGVTFECNEPPHARAEKTIIVGGRDTSAMTPADIDAYVRGQLAAGGDLYTLDAGALASLSPDVILTQDLCRVCALPSGQVAEALDYLGCRADVVSLDPHTLADVLSSILAVGRRLDVEDRAAALLASLRTRLSAVATRVADAIRPAVAVVEWIDPPFPAGHWVPDLVIAAGGRPVAAHPGADSRATTWADIVAAQPDIVVVSPCGYGLDGAAAQASEVAAQLPGVPIWAIDADALIVRPGPRVVDGVEALAGVFHPDRFELRTDQVRRVA
jgi:iron complex transport system substrate-binding protein